MRSIAPGYNAGDTIYCYFDTYDSNGASVTITGLAVTDIEIYKDGSTTQRSSDSGYTLLDTDGIDFDGVTGLHGFSIDTSDNSDAGFWADGSHYLINVNAITVDGQTVRFSYELRLGVLIQPTTSGRTLTIESDGMAHADVKEVEGSDATDQINAACDTALSDYDAPTKAELDAGLAALNDVSSADVNAACDTALTDYDAPTKAELDSGLAALNDLDAAGVRSAVGLASANLDTQLSAIAADLPTRATKNTALSNFVFPMIDSTDDVSLKTGLTVTGQVSQDGGALGALTNAVAEISNGLYKVDITAAEMNADVVVLRFSATGANDRIVTILTQPT